MIEWWCGMTKKRYGVYNYSSFDLSQLIDNSTNELFGIVDAVDLLNELNDETNILREEIKDFQTLLASREEVYIKPIIRTIEEAYENERTHIGRNVLRQLLEVIQ